jgi:hypothetical protein
MKASGTHVLRVSAVGDRLVLVARYGQKSRLGTFWRKRQCMKVSRGSLADA